MPDQEIDDGDMAYDAWKQDHEHKRKVPCNGLSDECEDSRCHKVNVFDPKIMSWRWMYKHEAHDILLPTMLDYLDRLNRIEDLLNE